MANDVIKINEVEMTGQLTIDKRTDKTALDFFTEDKAIIDSLQTVLQQVNIVIPDFPIISGEYNVTDWKYICGMYYVSFVNIPVVIPPVAEIQEWEGVTVGDAVEFQDTLMGVIPQSEFSMVHNRNLYVFHIAEDQPIDFNKVLTLWGEQTPVQIRGIVQRIEALNPTQYMYDVKYHCSITHAF